jgi:hypothetical protein
MTRTVTTRSRSGASSASPTTPVTHRMVSGVQRHQPRQPNVPPGPCKQRRRQPHFHQRVSVLQVRRIGDLALPLAVVSSATLEQQTRPATRRAGRVEHPAVLRRERPVGRLQLVTRPPAHAACHATASNTFEEIACLARWVPSPPCYTPIP